tara:strand:- start:95 stop:1159 length:1065 start_codon:yes stop_codon:yes gene_type:complete
MDQDLRKMDAKIAKVDPTNLEEIQVLDEEKNRIKRPYEREQLNFEYFFQIYYQRITLLIDNESQELSPVIWKCVKERAAQINRTITEGVSNAVVASALHQHSNPYLQIVVIILNAMDSPEEQEQVGYRGFSADTAALVDLVVSWLLTQIKNVEKLLQLDDSQVDGSSLIEEKGKSFQDVDDIVPKYYNELRLIEYDADDLATLEGCDSLTEAQKSTRAFKKLMNGDSKLAPEDQMAIVLRKIFFYLEFLNIFLKQSTNQASAHPKLEYLFEKPGFAESIYSLLDLSTLITKNRGINYQKSMANDVSKLRALVDKMGPEITGYDYRANKDTFSARNALKIGTRLEKGRFLFYKFH